MASLVARASIIGVLVLASCAGPRAPSVDADADPAPSSAARGPSGPPEGDRPVTWTVETEPVPDGRDAADDVAIAVDSDDPARSVIIGTNKKGDGGLIVYDLSGSVLQQTGGAPMNNVDLRQDVTMEGRTITLVVASTVDGRTLELFSYDDEERQLHDLDVGPVETGIRSAGVCLYRTAEGVVDVFATRGNGLVQQWRLVESPTDSLEPRKERELKFATHIEGCVVDDTDGRLFLSEETEGIWQVTANAASADDRTLLDSTGRDGHLAADVEGLTIARYPDGPALLIASSQGDDRFAVYRLDPDPTYVGSITVEGPDGDDVSHTDGLDVTLEPLDAEGFDRGVLVVQDDDNETPGGERLNQNFKMVPWRLVEDAIGVE